MSSHEYLEKDIKHGSGGDFWSGRNSGSRAAWNLQNLPPGDGAVNSSDLYGTGVDKRIFQICALVRKSEKMDYMESKKELYFYEIDGFLHLFAQISIQ